MTWTKTTWIAVALTLAGPVAYLLTMRIPFLAKTGLLIWLLCIPGAILGLLAASKAGTKTSTIVGLANAGLVLFFVLGFFVFSRVPSNGSGIAKGAPAPDFQLNDHNGHTVRLSEELTKGPVLLVFYRGHW